MKKNTTAEKAILDAQKAAKAIKENTDKSLQELMNNAIAKLVMESDDPEDDQDSYEVEDVKTEEEPKDSDDAVAADEPQDTASVEEPSAEDSESKAGEDQADGSDDAEDEWSDLDDFKVDDGNFDFTGLKGEELLKIFRQLDKGDKLVVAKNEDGSISVEDSEDDAADVNEPDPISDDEPIDAADDDDEFEVDFGDDSDSDEDPDDAEDNILDVEFSAEPEADEEEPSDDSDETRLDINEEDLGYTDVFAKKFNMKEPGDSKTTYSMDGGAPEGSEKPWAGKHTEPDYKKVEECGDAQMPDANIEEDGSGLNTKHKMVKTQNRINRSAQNQKVVSQDGEYKGNLNESVKKIIAKAKEVQKINEEYGKAIAKLKKSLMEAAVSNFSLVNMVNLLSECTMTIDEKKNLMGRFQNVKTLKESKETYEAIKKELNESAAKSAPIIEKQIKAEPSKSINETVIKNNPCIDLMDRMDNLFKA